MTTDDRGERRPGGRQGRPPARRRGEGRRGRGGRGRRAGRERSTGRRGAGEEGAEAGGREEGARGQEGRPPPRRRPREEGAGQAAPAKATPTPVVAPAAHRAAGATAAGAPATAPSRPRAPRGDRSRRALGARRARSAATTCAPSSRAGRTTRTASSAPTGPTTAGWCARCGPTPSPSPSSTRTAPATRRASCTAAASTRRSCRSSPATTASRSPTATARAARNAYTVDDPYRWMPTVGQLDEHLIREGRHERLWEVLGAHVRRYDTPRGTVEGVSFAVWAPNARGVKVTGDFDYWEARAYPMRSLGSSGVWEIFIPGVAGRQPVPLPRARRRRHLAGEVRPAGLRHRGPAAERLRRHRVDLHLGRRRLAGRAGRAPAGTSGR